MGILWALSDLHLSYAHNREELTKLKAHPDDSLILAGDIGETADHLHLAFSTVKPLFRHIWWIPGNHELYTLPHKHEEKPAKRGVEKYEECVDIAKSYGILTPEDDFEIWDPEEELPLSQKPALPHNPSLTHITRISRTTSSIGRLAMDPLAMKVASREPASGTDSATNSRPTSSNDHTSTKTRALICPIFTLYDYTFRPPEIPRSEALAWAREVGIEATDEHILHPDPYNTRDEWCHDLVKHHHSRLVAARKRADEENLKLIIVNHWPLKEELAQLFSVPRFKLWCGTKLTKNWHREFGAAVVVTGHCHLRRTDWIDGTRFEEVSLGYPKQWAECRDRGMDVNDMLREILPGPADAPESGNMATQWRRHG